MWISVLALLSILGSGLCSRPPLITPHGNFSNEPLSEADQEYLWRNARAQTYPSGFHYMYVAQDGHIAPDHKPSGHYIRIIGSPRVAKNTLYVAALEIYKMMKHAQASVFNNIANSDGGVGIFTAAEAVTIFPDFAHLRDRTECQGRCDGACKNTCTFDGRKYASLGGVTSTLSLVVDDNVMCTTHDKYHHHDNILIHEFAHTVHRRGMSSSQKNTLTHAYNNAKTHNLWRANSYAMANTAEYFGEGSGAFFLVNLQSSTGGMTTCSHGQCKTEAEVRSLLQSHDPQLFNLMSEVYTQNHPHTLSGLTVCYHAS